jgi:segregation and condensation protein B
MTTEAARALEAILMVAPEPVETNLLAQLLEVSQEQIEQLATDLQAGYEADGRGFMIARIAGGYRFQSHPDLAPYVERFVLEGQSARLSSAALETLAIVAYKQPLSRAQIAAIRGVNVDGVMRTLQQRGYIEEVARDPGPGQAVLFGTTREFLARLGLDTIDDLPSVADLMPGPDVVEALEQGLRAEPLTRPATDAEDEANDQDEASTEPDAGGAEQPVGPTGSDPDQTVPTGIDVEDEPEVPDAIEEPAWMREPVTSAAHGEVDEPDPSDEPSSTSVE